MDFLFEILFELIVEGTIELGTSRKVPGSLRFFALLLFGLIYGVLIAVLATIAIGCWKRGDILASVLVFAIDVGLAFFIVWGTRKKYKENREKKDSE